MNVQPNSNDLKVATGKAREQVKRGREITDLEAYIHTIAVKEAEKRHQDVERKADAEKHQAVIDACANCDDRGFVWVNSTTGDTVNPTDPDGDTAHYCLHEGSSSNA